MQDLDIRGAGNLLGAEQSGFITDMGYETYQKILAEAMEELGVETGISTVHTDESFVEDCTIETDQPAMIPDSYIDITAEKIRIYKQLDGMTSDKEIDRSSLSLWIVSARCLWSWTTSLMWSKSGILAENLGSRRS